MNNKDFCLRFVVFQSNFLDRFTYLNLENTNLFLKKIISKKTKLKTNFEKWFKHTRQPIRIDRRRFASWAKKKIKRTERAILIF